MAKKTDILSRFADLGEEALQKLPGVPGGDRLMEMVNQSKGRLDEMQKRLRGLDVLETRVDELERRLAKLERSTGKSGAAKTTAAKKPAAAKTPAKTPPTKPAA